MGPGGPTTPQAFGKFLADLITPEVAQAVGEKVKVALREAPAKLWDVVRQTPVGPVPRQMTLAQIMAELTDELKVDNDLKRHLISSNSALIVELQLNRKLGEEIAKGQKRQRRRDEDEDDD